MHNGLVADSRLRCALFVSLPPRAFGSLPLPSPVLCRHVDCPQATEGDDATHRQSTRRQQAEHGGEQQRQQRAQRPWQPSRSGARRGPWRRMELHNEPCSSALCQERVCAHARAILPDGAWPLRRALTTARHLCSYCLLAIAFVERLAQSFSVHSCSLLVCAGSFTEPNLPIAAKCTCFISHLYCICRARPSEPPLPHVRGCWRERDFA